MIDKIKIAVLDFSTSTVGFHTMTPFQYDNIVKELGEKDPDLDDVVQYFLTEIFNYHLSEIHYMFDQRLNIEFN